MNARDQQPYHLKHHFIRVAMKGGMLRDPPCHGCGYQSWKLDLNVQGGYCSACVTHWTRQITDGKLAVVSRDIPWDKFLKTRVLEFMCGSRGTDEIARHRCTKARYMTLSKTRGDLQIFRDTVDNTDRWTMYECRWDLLQLILSFLERHWIQGEIPAEQ